MSLFLIGILVGFSLGYPLGLFVNFLDWKGKNNGR